MRDGNEHTDTGDVRLVNSFRASLLASVLLAACPAFLQGQAVKTAWAKPAKTPETASVPARVVASAMSYLGVPYANAGDSRQGMDCSGMVYRVFQDSLGCALSRSVAALYRGTQPGGAPLHIGDLLFFDTDKLPPSVPTHVGIYVGNGRIVHAASEGPRAGVIVSQVEDPYYRDRLIGVRRALPWRDPVLNMTLRDEAARAVEREPFPSGEKVTIRVFNEMSGGGPVSLSLSQGGKEVLSRWITPGGLGKPAEVTFTTGIGSWSVHVSRIFKGRTLADVAFAVVE
jgi:hypothetical protein